MSLEPRLSLLTLGTDDLARARKFYEDVFGWKASSASQGDVVFFKSPGAVIALFPREKLAEDAGVPNRKGGFDGVTLAFNVMTKEEVAPLLAKAKSHGAEITKPAQEAFWGGFTGYFADPDGHLWEIAWNPGFKYDEFGFPELP